MSTCIMQPTYLPWSGYFSLLSQCEKFIVLDDVQFNKRSWQQRNKIKSKDSEIFLTVPVITKNKRFQKINEVLIDDSRNFIEKHIKSISTNYSKSKYYKEISNELFDILECKFVRLMDLNLKLINYFIKYLEIELEILFSSKFETVSGKDDLIFDLCKLSNTDNYITPFGSKAYLDNKNLEKFYKNNIKVNFFRFSNVEYKQINGKFISNLSIIDLIFNEGKNAKKILKL